MLNERATKQYRQIGTLFIIVGILFTLIGLAETAYQSIARQTLQTAEAEILSVHSGYTEVQYFVNGQMYVVELPYSSTSQNIGDAMKIYYKAENPEKASAYLPFFNIIFFFVGMIVLAVGICLKKHYIKLEQKKQYLMEYGERITAKVIGMETNFHFRRNYSYAKILVCQYSAPDGTTYLFKSQPIWADFSNSLKGKMVVVYVERENLNNYYVDLSAVLPPLRFI